MIFCRWLLGGIFFSFCSPFLYAADQWCIEDPTDPPCDGAPGKCTRNHDGTLGGFVANTAFVDKSWNFPGLIRKNIPTLGQSVQICDYARVTGHAVVSDHAKISGKAWIYGFARISGNSQIFDDARASGTAQIFDNTLIYGNSWVYGNAMVWEDAQIYGRARVYSNARIWGNARVYDDARIAGWAGLSDMAQVYENAKVFENAYISESAQIKGRAQISGMTWVRGDLLISEGSFSVQTNPPNEGVTQSEVYTLFGPGFHSLASNHFDPPTHGIGQNEILNRDGVQVLADKSTPLLPATETAEQCLTLLNSAERNPSLEEELCSICLEPLAQKLKDGIIYTQCQHFFCKTCLDHWTTHHSNCPICRGMEVQLNRLIIKQWLPEDRI